MMCQNPKMYDSQLKNISEENNKSLEIYWNCLQQCQMTAADPKETITNNRVMQVAITHFRNHANLTDDTINWKNKPVTDRTWNNFKCFLVKQLDVTRRTEEHFNNWG